MTSKNKQMKFVIPILLLFIFFGNTLSAQTENSDRKEFLKITYDQKFLSISPLIAPRICFGLLKSTKQSDDRYFESIYYIHAFDTINTYRHYGIAYRGNAFIGNDKRTGFFLLATGGIDYLRSVPFCFATDGNGCSEMYRILPNLTIGLGYSFNMKNDSYLRLEWDLGLKWLLSNIYLSYVW